VTRAWIAAALLCAGCASFSDVPPIPEQPRHGPALPTARLAVTHQYLVEANNGWVVADLPNTADRAERAIRERGWVLVTNDEQSPLLTVDLTEYQNGGGTGLVNVLTGFIIPGATDYRTLLKLSWKDGPNTELACRREADSRTWNEVFLVFLYPFNRPLRVRGEITEALTLQCLAELLEKAR
jgi:hypothetical protein